MGSDFDPGRERAQIGPLQEVDPVVERGMGVGLADEDEAKAVQEGAPAKRLVGIDVVAQQDGLERRVLGSRAPGPARPARAETLSTRPAVNTVNIIL